MNTSLQETSMSLTQSMESVNASPGEDEVMVTNVTSLLKTVKTVEDKGARGTRALESSVEAINQELKNYASTEHVEEKLNIEEIHMALRQMTISTAKAVAAGKSGKQEGMVAVANLGRKAVLDLLRVCKGIASETEGVDNKQRLLDRGHECASIFIELLEQIKKTLLYPGSESEQRLIALSKDISFTLSEISQAAETIKDVNWINTQEPKVLIETEILGAAHSIEAAIRKLSQFEATYDTMQVNKSLTFEEQILTASKAIAAATSALVKATSTTQQELFSQGKISKIVESVEHDHENQWSKGLVSAAHMVAAATHSLCDAANAMAQGQGSKEKLISAAKQVASSTAQLLVACKVKVDVDSIAMHKLQEAGNAVKKATEALVITAQNSERDWPSSPDSEVLVNQKMVGGLAQIISAQEEVLIKERELESARRKLETIYRAKYRNKDDDEQMGTAF